MPVPRSRNAHIQQQQQFFEPTSAQVDISLSPSSSYEDISSSYPYQDRGAQQFEAEPNSRQQHLQYIHTPGQTNYYSSTVDSSSTLDDSHLQLPLHHMEARSRRAHGSAGMEKGGWASSDVAGGGPSYRTAGAGVYETVVDSDGKGIYEKERLGYATGKLPPRQSKTPVNVINKWAPLVYTLLSIFTRVYAIGLSPTVVWDEAHFGKFASHYLKREFYFDVHPPLGKMLVAFVGLISGFDGNYEFKSGETYPANIPYQAMRVWLSMFGAAMVPLGWYTASELHFSMKARHLVTLMVLFDNAWLTISRFILLDSLLLFFTCTTIYCLALFHNQQYRSFQPEWWLALSLTGISIGCVMSVKWVGFFAMAVVGLYTIEDLWEKFGDLKMPITTYIRHWIARVVCLIGLPAIVYLISFKIHFLILNQSGPGDAQMSSLFQANLEGNDFSQNPLEVAFGSVITLKNVGYGGGLLHSHVQSFPVGSLQQQVTCYHYKDDNNKWTVLPTWNEPRLDLNGEIRMLTDSSRIRLQHVPTTRMLHSHLVPAPITGHEWEVSGYGNETVGDIHDHWILEIASDTGGRKLKHDGTDVVHSLTTKMRFRHEVLGCYLKANNVILPQWGFKQTEVSCDKDNNPSDPHTMWNVEQHINDRLPASMANQYSSPFFADFWHLNVAMMTSNNALVPDPDKFDVLASVPLDWPFLNVGLRMCGWGDNQAKYYLIGNPIVWWGSTAALIVSLVMISIYILRWQRKYKDLDPEEWTQLLHPAKIAMFGWLLHYIPFLIMGRVTYIHHYLPTLWFAVLMAGHVFDQLIFAHRRKYSELTKSIVFGISALAITGTFWWFRAISFGMTGPVRDYWGLQWRKNWNIY